MFFIIKLLCDVNFHTVIYLNSDLYEDNFKIITSHFEEYNEPFNYCWLDWYENPHFQEI